MHIVGHLLKYVCVPKLIKIQRSVTKLLEK